MHSNPAVLIIAGTDSSGGAGLARDIQVLAELNVNVRCAVTAVTAQTDAHVSSVHHVPQQIVLEQIKTALATSNIGAIKIGMLGTDATVKAVLAALPLEDRIPIVLDPVLVSSSGGRLLDAAGVTMMRDQLFRRATLITPNLAEAALLLDTHPAKDEAGMIEQAQRFLRMGAQAVLLKGGHAIGAEAVDIFVTTTDAPIRLVAGRVNATLRGTGCALSSAIAASLAQEMQLLDACRRAKEYVLNKLKLEN